MSGFFFRKRIERIDWKRLASVDVHKVASQMDIDALQENLSSIAFCDIDSEIDTRYADTNLVKLFQLAQLLIEYLLFSQDYLTNTVDSLRRENENIKKEADVLRKRLNDQVQRLMTTRKECHRRRLLLLAQQRLMDNGPQSYFRCPHCPKAFINSSFLNAHLFRRHAEAIAALQKVDFNASGLILQTPEKGICPVKEKVSAEQRQTTLTTNLEQQIKEVLDHIKTQVPPTEPLPPQPPPESSHTVVQKSLSPSPDATWKKRATELERQLKEEREHLRQLEERNRTWQETITSQHKVDIERVREMFEAELRNLREENLEKQKELLQLRIKGTNPIVYGDLEDDVPLQLERLVKSLEQNISEHQHSITNASTPQSMQQTESENAEALSLTGTYNLPICKMVNNANKAGVEHSLPMLKMLGMSNEPGFRDDAFNLCSESSESSNEKQRRTQKAIHSGKHMKYSGVRTQVIRIETMSSDKESQESSSVMNPNPENENQEVRKEDTELDQTPESIHLITYVIPSSNRKSETSEEASPKRGRYYSRAENRIVQILDDDDGNSLKYSKERLRQSSSAEKASNTDSKKAEKSLQASDKSMRIDPLEGIPYYKDQLEEFRANSSAMRRLRNEVESLLEEQLMDHDVEPSAKGLSRNKFNELTDILGQERLHLARKFPSFEEIRASLARKVDRLALQAIHSKREHTGSSPGRGESANFKRARPSRGSERERPPSGRPASLTSLATTLSPIAEHQRGATASPTAFRRPAGALSKQSLFEDSGNDDEDDGDDDVEGNKKRKGTKVPKGGRKEGVIKRKLPQPLDESDHDDDDSEEDEVGFHSKSASPGHSVKFSDENLHKNEDDEDIDYRFVRRKIDDEEDDDDNDSEIDKSHFLFIKKF